MILFLAMYQELLTQLSFVFARLIIKTALEQVNKKAARIEDKLSRQTARYLSRLKKQEKKLTRLLRRLGTSFVKLNNLHIYIGVKKGLILSF